MSFDKAMRILRRVLRNQQPQTFSSTWILTHAPNVYRYIRGNVRSTTDAVDWDKVTSALSRNFQKRWVRYRYRSASPYEDTAELDLILNKYRDKLYTLIASSGEADRRVRDVIIVSLVRVAQRGNTLAKQEIIKWMRCVVDDWVERYYQLYKWKGYTDDIDERISACIRCYRYTGSFIGYLFKTFEYSARGMRPLQAYSFDDPVLNGARTRIDYYVEK